MKTPPKSTVQPAGLREEYFVSLDDLEVGEAVVRDENGPAGPGWLCFREPVDVLVAAAFDQVKPVVDAAANYANSGSAVGFVSYEASPTFDPAIHAWQPDWPVLAWFALYDRSPSHHRELLPAVNEVEVELDDPELLFPEYLERFERVKLSLQQGSCYQANLTFRQKFHLAGSAEAFFTTRCGVRPPPYATFINGGDWRLASFSPELLAQRECDLVTMRPMKGTAPCPADKVARQEAIRALRSDPKTIAENVMIVDMVRNDLGAVAEVGSVQTPRLLDVERHRGLLQVTSTVTARSSVPTPQLLASIFPPASVTGAPKVAATKLIAELETSPRGPYCGAIAVLSPGRQGFSVAIRTAFIDAGNGNGEFGIGSGIVWDSEATSEYEECLSKRDFLLNPGTTWALVEAFSSDFLDDPARVNRHLARLQASADELGVPLDLDNTQTKISQLQRSLIPMKVRIAAAIDGRTTISIEPSAVGADPIRATLATTPISSQDPNFRHKTNSRDVFDAHLEANPDFDEVLLYNERGELTEFCRGNVVLQINSVLYTPDPAAGCLRGINISNLVTEGIAVYSCLKKADLERAEAVYLSNSVVGLLRVYLM